MLEDFGIEETTASAVNAGDIFGRLTVLATGVKPGTYRYMAVCKCACGSSPRLVRFDSLKKGVTKSCGCLHREDATTHGLSKHHHYGRWKNMMDRCYNEKCKSYPDYGGRGISVCSAWHDLEAFIACLPQGFFEGAELDRINNDGNYEPKNVRWVTKAKNSGNRRSCQLFTIGGQTKMLSDWAMEHGKSVQLVWDRVFECGWPIERALNEGAINADERMRRAREARWSAHSKRAKPSPKTSRKVHKITFNGKLMTISQLSDVTGVASKLLRKRIFERGWPIEKAVIPPM